MSATPQRALPPDLLAQIRLLAASARSLVSSDRPGQHRSRRRGAGSEFAEHQPYVPGDDLRHLDWKVLARSDHYVVRRHEVERQLDAWILLDGTASMDFGTTDQRPPAPWGPWPATKWQAARTVAAAPAFLLLRQGDRVGLSLLGGDRAPLPPHGSQRQLVELLRRVEGASPGGEGELAAAAREITLQARRGLIVVLSDLLSGEDEDAWLAPLRAWSARGHEVWVLHVVDPAERNFPYAEPTRFEALEGVDSLLVNARELARTYRAEFAAFCERSRQRCLTAGLRYRRLDTDLPLDEHLAAFLRERA